ncbi:MAG: undecaprenyldiphospho-muramoylpentapeptide beta-N-acetylglucosaminyltransferase [Clostridia bacterium]|nr:undecaprenyldiphospho-muramoylpentapeptide beta-N-acetylglucosaminyltransferase [Clostridia bacterium]
MKAILTAGGTAGHINPAIAIAKEITADGGQVLFIGNETGMETELVKKEGFEIKTIRVSGFKRSLSPKNFKTIWQAAKGISDTKKIIKEFAPDVVIGCGGYVSGSAVFAAAQMKIPTLIHEQNAFPGLTNKILAKMVSRVCISFEESRKYFGASDKIVYTGNPVRQNILGLKYEDARASLGIDGTLVLVFGGSLGAKAINDAMIEALPLINKDITVIWGTGKKRYDGVMEALSETDIPKNVKIMPYIYNMDEVMAASDIVVSRAGAITISEICVKGKASVLIPSPNVTGNHQMHNALALKNADAADIIEEANLNGVSLADAIEKLVESKDKMKTMQANAITMAAPFATTEIYKEIKKITATH